MLYIIIVTYNGKFWIEKCLNRVLESEYGQSNIIIVDNCSEDNTVDIIEKKFPSINLIKLKKNVGFGKANNIGIKFALEKKIEYVFLLNQDVYISPETIKKLIIVHKKNKDYGIVSPIHLDGSGKKMDEGFSGYMGYRNNDSFFSDYILGNKKGVYSIPFVNAASWLVPEKTLLEIGGFDPYFFHYGEDIDYCHRVVYHGYKIGVVADVFILHDRENRLVEKGKVFSKKNYQYLKLLLKVEYGNINIPFSNKKIIKRVSKLFIKAFLNLIILRLKYFRGYLKEFLLILNNIFKIKKDRSIVEKKMSHFL